MEKKERKMVNTNLGILLICLFSSIFTLVDFIVIDKALDKYVDCSKCTKCEIKDNGTVSGNTDNTPVIDDKKLLSEEDALNIGNLMFDKASSFYSSTVLTTSPFCGRSLNENNIVLDEGTYNKASNFSSIQDVKDYLLEFLSQNIVNAAVTNSGYKEIDGSLYCLASSGKGFLTNYTGNKNLKVLDIQEDKITYSIEFIYADFDSDNASCKFDWNFRLTPSDLSLCSPDDLFNVNADFVIEKNDNGNWIITKFADHISIEALNRNSVSIRYYE